MRKKVNKVGLLNLLSIALSSASVIPFFLACSISLSTHFVWWRFPNIRNFELIKAHAVKVLAPRTGSQPSFALDRGKSVFKGINTMIISKVVSPVYVLAVLDSKLSDFWYMHFGYEYHSGKTKKYEPDKARRYLIPIRLPTKRQQEAVEGHVETMIRLKTRLSGFGDKRTDERA